MAMVGFARQTYKSGGQHATALVTYITRQPMRDISAAAQQLRYISKPDREDLLYTHSRNLPPWAEGNAHIFFRTAEIYERANGVAFEAWKITLPQEFSHRQNMDLTRDLVDAIAGDRLPITYALHDPHTLDGQGKQPHLHLLISARANDGRTRTPVQYFQRYNEQYPGRGGVRKDPAFYHRGAVMAHRVLVTDVINLHLERAGCTARVHPASLESRGIARQPEPKLLPSESHAYRKDGTITPQMQQVLEVRALRQQTRAEELADARRYWDERKVTLGITSTMDVTVQLARIGEARARRRDQAPVRQGAQGLMGVATKERTLAELARDALAQAWEEAQGVWTDTQATQHLLDAGWDVVRTARPEGESALAVALDAQQAQEQARAWQSLEHEFRQMGHRLDAMREADGATGHVSIRLWDKAQEPDQGHGRGR